MGEKRRVIGSAGGALGLGTVAAALGTCCGAPWAVGLLGVTGAVALARLAPLQPFLLAGSIILLAAAFWLTYRQPKVCADGTCDTSNRRGLRWIVWIAALLVAVLAATALVPIIAAWL
ncbi:MAG: mercuric transporter MerT family protein [Rhodanobacteraceae bacterium]